MFINNFCTLFIIILCNSLVFGCLITNCPRGGRKRTGKTEFSENNLQKCPNCGPGMTGQCFGPNICCGPFGCLIGTIDSYKCKYDPEPCIAGSKYCKWRHGRCASNGVCCNQDSCFIDKECYYDDATGKLTKGKSSEIFEILNRNVDYNLES